MFKIPYRLTIISFFLTLPNLFAQGFGASKPLSEWYFHLGDVKLGGRATLDHSKWEKVSVPPDWTVEQFGIAWYRTHIEIPIADRQKRKYLYFEGVYNNSEVYFNGKWLGKRPNGYVSFGYDITPYLKPGGNNVVAVRVDHSQDADSRWYTGSGIYRPVHLVTANQIHIDQWGVFYSTQTERNNKASIRVESKISNHLSQPAKVLVRHELLDNRNKIVGISQSTLDIEKEDFAISDQKFVLSDPRRWSVDDPYLYRLKTTVSSKGSLLDQSVVNVGIRSLTFDANKGFALNGQWMKIKGVCLHHDAGVLGSAVPKAVWKREY